MIKLRKLLREEVDDESKLIALAKARGFTHVTYRGDIFDSDIVSYSPKERREHGIFTTPEKQVARSYARDREPRKFFVKANKVLDLMDDSLENMTWVNKWGEAFDDWRDPQSGEEVSAWDILSGGRMFDYEGNWSGERWVDIQATAEDEGYDMVILPDYDRMIGIFPSWVVFDEHNIKLADTITYDDNKTPIPYEQRFNVKSDDIRY